MNFQKNGTVTCFFHGSYGKSPEHDVVTIQIAQQDVSEVSAFGKLFWNGKLSSCIFGYWSMPMQ